MEIFYTVYHIVPNYAHDSDEIKELIYLEEFGTKLEALKWCENNISAKHKLTILETYE